MNSSKIFVPLLLLSILLSCQVKAQYVQYYGTPASAAKGNIALYKPTKHSSSYEEACACVAVDGNLNGDWWKHEISATNVDNGAWWEVDLLQQYAIKEITVYNRTDAVPERLRDFYIKVSNKPFRKNEDGEQFAYRKEAVAKEATFSNQKSGRYIRIYLNRADILSLAEVVVKGELQGAEKLPDNIALGKATRQVSNYGKSFANRANDGQTKGNFFKGEVAVTANADANDWWEVDLGKMYRINEVRIFNRTDAAIDRLKDFDIYVTDKPMEELGGAQIKPFKKDSRGLDGASSKVYSRTQSGPGGETGNSFGRYVRIQLNGRISYN